MTGPDHPRSIRRLATLVVGLPDPGATAAFLSEGLSFTVLPGAEGAQVLCAGDYGGRSDQVALILAERPALELLELRFDLADGVGVDDVARRATEHGAEAVVVGDDGRVRFRDPNGLPVACGAPADDPALAALPPSGLRPRRLGHLNAKVVDLALGTRFWVRAMGMWLSEAIGDDLTFLRFGAEHHNLGLRVADRTTLHHVGFEIPGWDSYRAILDHLADAGHQVEFGPGRHAVGRNMFTYLRDPSSGLRLELFTDMATVAYQDDPEVAPIRWRAEDRLSRTLNRWSSAPPPASFLE